MAVEGTNAVVAVATTVAMAPADNSGNSGGRQWRRQAETEAAAGADNNQPESSSNSSGRNGDWLRWQPRQWQPRLQLR